MLLVSRSLAPGGIQSHGAKDYVAANNRITVLIYAFVMCDGPRETMYKGSLLVHQDTYVNHSDRSDRLQGAVTTNCLKLPLCIFSMHHL